MLMLRSNFHCLKAWAMLICMAILYSGCGYRAGQGGGLSSYSTISVPYVDGDLDGSLTSALVNQITRSGAFQYVSSGGDLLLLVKVNDLSDENIGFRYDRHKDGRLTRRVIPTETRITALVEISVLNGYSGAILLGPARISANVDFDHDYYAIRHKVNIFSLGQLTEVEEAYNDAHRPLNKVLAQKIVDYITASW